MRRVLKWYLLMTQLNCPEVRVCGQQMFEFSWLILICLPLIFIVLCLELLVIWWLAFQPGRNGDFVSHYFLIKAQTIGRTCVFLLSWRMDLIHVTVSLEKRKKFCTTVQHCNKSSNSYIVLFTTCSKEGAKERSLKAE